MGCFKLCSQSPCIRLPCLKFELTNQDLAGEKNSTVLNSIYVDKKSVEVGQLFSLEAASNIHEKEFILPETLSDRKK